MKYFKNWAGSSTRNILFAGLILLFSCSSALADFDSAGWKYEKELMPASGGSGDFGEVVFDGEVLSGSKSDLSDVRIMSGEREIPYVMDVEAPSFARETHSARILNKGVQAGSTFLVLDLAAEGFIHNRVELSVTSTNFRREMQVEGSSDMANWFTLANGSIYDYTLEFKARDTSLSYTDSTYRYLRITISDKGEAPLGIVSATISRESYGAGKEVSYEVPIVERTEVKDRQANSILLDMGVKGLPTNRLVLETPSTNFNREVALEGTNDGTAWSIITNRDVIFSYSTPKFTGNKLELRFPDQNYRFLKLTIFNRDNQPIQIEKGTLYGTVRKAIFPYEVGKSYKLYYGNPGARYAQYDLNNYLQYFDASARVKFSLGNKHDNEQYKYPTGLERPFSERYSWLLTTVLVLVVLGMGFMVFRLFKKQSTNI